MAHIYHNFITCVLFKGTTKTKILDRKDFKSDLFFNYKDAFRFLQQHLKFEYIIKDGGPRKEISEIALEAYITLWEGLTINQKNLMCALAWEEHPAVFSKKFLAKYSLGASSSIQKALKKLLGQDLIQQDNGSYIILDPFLKRWIRRIWK